MGWVLWHLYTINECMVRILYGTWSPGFAESNCQELPHYVDIKENEQLCGVGIVLIDVMIYGWIRFKMSADRSSVGKQ